MIKPASVWISYKGRLIRKSTEVLILRYRRMNGAPQTLREEANAIPILWWPWWYYRACFPEGCGVMNVSGVDNKLPRSIHFSKEAHSLGKPPQRQYPLHPFPPAHISIPFRVLRLSDGGIIKLFSQVSCGPRWREGIVVRTHLRGELQRRPR